VVVEDGLDACEFSQRRLRALIRPHAHKLGPGATCCKPAAVRWRTIRTASATRRSLHHREHMLSPGLWTHILQCIECGRLDTDRAGRGWRGYRCDDPDIGEAPAVAFYCPACAASEFGRHETSGRLDD
jgi:hypothetical protein